MIFSGDVLGKKKEAKALNRLGRLVRWSSPVLRIRLQNIGVSLILAVLSVLDYAALDFWTLDLDWKEWIQIPFQLCGSLVIMSILPHAEDESHHYTLWGTVPNLCSALLLVLLNL